ncbi:hypothetical protein WJX74_007005 [Apatococcus lobatus]|uniref:Uncharacterized protein n=1 Tax=Apatococcus lobatus TaxID=904363 RepID=A0AAW1RC91_9CHLO
MPPDLGSRPLEVKQSQRLAKARIPTYLAAKAVLERSGLHTVAAQVGCSLRTSRIAMGLPVELESSQPHHENDLPVEQESSQLHHENDHHVSSSQSPLASSSNSCLQAR